MRNFIFHLWNKLIFLFDKIDYSTKVVSARPKENEILPNVVVIVGHKDLPKWALMQCPCGCGELLTLSLMKNFRPYWNYKIDKWNRITLSPSIWKKDGCRSHFFIKKGKVIWSNN